MADEHTRGSKSERGRWGESPTGDHWLAPVDKYVVVERNIAESFFNRFDMDEDTTAGEIVLFQEAQEKLAREIGRVLAEIEEVEDE